MDVSGTATLHARRIDPPLLVLMGAVVLGVALRVVQWAYARSLWLDEVALALNLQTRGYAELTEQLDSEQVAPFGWLWAQRWVLLHLGQGDQTMRLLPLLLGCAGLFAVALLARRLLSPWTAAVAVGLAAVSPPLVFYSNELKQYSSDAFWVPLLAWLAIRCTDEGASWRRYLTWAGVGALGVAFSHALLLALAAFGLALLGVVVVGRRRHALGPLVAAGATVGAAAAGVYLIQLEEVAGTSTLESFWTKEGGFPGRPVGVGSVVRWLGDRATTLPGEPLELHPALVGLALLALGALALARRSAPAAAVLVSPVVVAVIAAVARQYPLAGRVALYLVPLGLVVACAGLDLRGRLRQPGRVVVAVLLAVVTVPQLLEAARQVRAPLELSETRGAFERVSDGIRPGDVVLVHYTAGTSALYYAPKLGIPFDGVLSLAERDTDDCRRYEVPRGLESARRLWIVFGVRLTGRPKDEREVVLAHVGRLGDRVSEHVDTAAAVYLYDTGTDLADDEVTAGSPPRDCLIAPTPPPFPPPS